MTNINPNTSIPTTGMAAPIQERRLAPSQWRRKILDALEHLALASQGSQAPVPLISTQLQSGEQRCLFASAVASIAARVGLITSSSMGCTFAPSSSRFQMAFSVSSGPKTFITLTLDPFSELRNHLLALCELNFKSITLHFADGVMTSTDLSNLSLCLESIDLRFRLSLAFSHIQFPDKSPAVLAKLITKHAYIRSLTIEGSPDSEFLEKFVPTDGPEVYNHLEHLALIDMKLGQSASDETMADTTGRLIDQCPCLQKLDLTNNPGLGRVTGHVIAEEERKRAYLLQPFQAELDPGDASVSRIFHHRWKVTAVGEQIQFSNVSSIAPWLTESNLKTYYSLPRMAPTKKKVYSFEPSNREIDKMARFSLGEHKITILDGLYHRLGVYRYRHNICTFFIDTDLSRQDTPLVESLGLNISPDCNKCELENSLGQISAQLPQGWVLGVDRQQYGCDVYAIEPEAFPVKPKEAASAFGSKGTVAAILVRDPQVFPPEVHIEIASSHTARTSLLLHPSNSFTGLVNWDSLFRDAAHHITIRMQGGIIDQTQMQTLAESLVRHKLGHEVHLVFVGVYFAEGAISELAKILAANWSVTGLTLEDLAPHHSIVCDLAQQLRLNQVRNRLKYLAIRNMALTDEAAPYVSSIKNCSPVLNIIDLQGNLFDFASGWTWAELELRAARLYEPLVVIHTKSSDAEAGRSEYFRCSNQQAVLRWLNEENINKFYSVNRWKPDTETTFSIHSERPVAVLQSTRPLRPGTYSFSTDCFSYLLRCERRALDWLLASPRNTVTTEGDSYQHLTEFINSSSLSVLYESLENSPSPEDRNLATYIHFLLDSSATTITAPGAGPTPVEFANALSQLVFPRCCLATQETTIPTPNPQVPYNTQVVFHFFALEKTPPNWPDECVAFGGADRTLHAALQRPLS